MNAKEADYGDIVEIIFIIGGVEFIIRWHHDERCGLQFEENKPTTRNIKSIFEVRKQRSGR